MTIELKYSNIERLMFNLHGIKMPQRYAHLAPGYLEKAVNSLDSI